MTIPKDTFPFAPLGASDVSLITAVLGVRSSEDMPLLDCFRQFLGANRKLALPEEWYRRYLETMGMMCLGELEIMDERAPLDYNRGALLYAGAVCVAGGLRPLPRNGEVLSEKKEGSLLDLATTAFQAVDDIPSFGGVLEQVRPLFSIETGYNGLDAARIGAGLLHIITTESVAAAERNGTSLSLPGVTRTVVDGIQMDDGLRSLMDMFRNTDWPKSSE